jgi:hypothetical protein
LYSAECLPNVIGEGGIFAFSGLDGETRAASGFVATWGASPYSLLFHTAKRRVLEVSAPEETMTEWVTGDACRFATPVGSGTFVYGAWHTLMGTIPSDVRVSLRLEDGAEAVGCPQPVSGAAASCMASDDEDNGEYIVLAKQAERFAVSFGATREEAEERACAGLQLDVEQAVSDRLVWLARVPVLEDNRRTRLLYKCFSVMKANTLAAEAGFGQMWSTPDRVPHKDMWLWDTAFHSFGMNKLDPDAAWQCLKTMLEAIRPDGMMPHQINPFGKYSRITQPPILAWGVWANYCSEPDAAKLRYALPYLQRYLAWNLEHRDRNRNGLFEWEIHGDPLCRSGESGMDNSARFDEAADLDAVDFSTFMACDMKYVAWIAAELGQEDVARTWRERAKQTADRIIVGFWNEEDGFYYDKHGDGRLSTVKAVSGFLPLLLEELPERHAERLIGMLNDPKHFAAEYPIPSLALSEPAWGTDMWRGPAWINMNYMIVQGLKLHGRSQEADKLAERTIDLVQRYVERYGVTFEYYDSSDRLPPVDCDRKGPPADRYNIRHKMDSIRDYHWTAALTACLLLEKDTDVNMEGGIAVNRHDEQPSTAGWTAPSGRGG